MLLSLSAGPKNFFSEALQCSATARCSGAQLGTGMVGSAGDVLKVVRDIGDITIGKP